MKVALSMGSNQGDRLANLRTAIRHIEARVLQNVRCSPVIESAAWLKAGSPADWDMPFLNTVLEGESLHSPQETLSLCQAIEREMGRGEHEVWSPRLIDIDILAWDQIEVYEPELQIPHHGLLQRPFVLDPWVHLSSSLHLPKASSSLLSVRRSLGNARPLLMGILNVTPDSFSDGGQFYDQGDAARRAQELLTLSPAIIDLGGQSTRPRAEVVGAEQEWQRLERALDILHDVRNESVRPWISIDTFWPEVAQRAIDWGVEIINDVSGLDDPAMMELAAGSNAHFVFMHHLGVPVEPSRTLPLGCDPVSEVMRWAENKLELLAARAGVSLDRLIFDPGIGFGKTPAQSLELIRRAAEFKALPVRVLYGHSRKSYQSKIDLAPHADREGITLAHSLHLAKQGVEILRVHDVRMHRSALLADDQLMARGGDR